MSKKSLKTLLKSVLIGDAPMSASLISDNLLAYKDELCKSLEDDNEDVIFALDEHNGNVAMMLIEKDGSTYTNEDAKKKLKSCWKDNYKNNIEMFLSTMVDMWNSGEFAIIGFSIEKGFVA